MKNNKEILKKIKLLMFGLGLIEYEHSGGSLTFKIVGPKEIPIVVTAAAWDESPHNGSISDYKEQVLTLNDINSNNYSFSKVYEDLEKSYFRLKEYEQQKKWLSDIGIV